MGDFEELFPLLMAGGKNKDLMPLLMMLMQRDCGCSNSSSSSNSDSGQDDGGDASPPSTFDAYIATLVGFEVQVSVSSAVDNAIVVNGKLTDVGSDYIILKDVWSGGVQVGMRTFLAIPISNIVGIDRIRRRRFEFPFMNDCCQSRSGS